jgi:drug/metabolite transporter (DMT)-like permease
MLKPEVNSLPNFTTETIAERGKAAPKKVSAGVVNSTLKTRAILLAPILLSVALNIVGQLVLKRGMNDLGPISLTERGIFDIIFAIATNPFVIGGVFVYAFSVLCWLVGLSRAPLSYAYPFISLSYVVILFASYFLLGETVSLLRLAGVVVICIGVLFVAFS